MSIGGIGLVQATGGGGNAMTAIAPCRLVDTRAGGQIGPRSTPLGADETVTFMAAGNNGNCVGIAADAQAIEVQLTATETSEASYLTAFPADLSAVPNVSQLNTRPGQVISNSTIISLSPTGEFKVYNSSGSTNVIIDVLAVYSPSAAGGAAGPAGPAGPAGVDGPAGPAGGDGHDGAPGIAGYYVRNATIKVMAGKTVSHTLTCKKTDEVALSGGVTLDSGANYFVVNESGPPEAFLEAGVNVAHSWRSTVTAGSADTAFRPWVICAKVVAQPAR